MGNTRDIGLGLCLETPEGVGGGGGLEPSVAGDDTPIHQPTNQQPTHQPTKKATPTCTHIGPHWLFGLALWIEIKNNEKTEKVSTQRNTKTTNSCI